MMSNYWAERERAHAQKLALLQKNDKRLFKSFAENSIAEIERAISRLVVRYAGKENITMAEANERASKFDVKKFEKTAAKYVKNRDFSNKANRELRLYNLKMSMSRLQLLKNEITIELAKVSDQVEAHLRSQLGKSAMNEIQRQAGILVAGKVHFSKAATDRIVNGSFKGASFSDIWGKDMSQIQALLEKTLDNAITRGENPKTMIAEVRNVFVNRTAYEAQRLLVTETAHIQTQIQLDSFAQAGFTKVKYISESGACKDCQELDDRVFLIKEAQEMGIKPPRHPHCRCSLIPEP